MRLTKENILIAIEWSIDYYEKKLRTEEDKNKIIEYGHKQEAYEEMKEDIETQFYWYHEDIFKKEKTKL